MTRTRENFMYVSLRYIILLPYCLSIFPRNPQYSVVQSYDFIKIIILLTEDNFDWPLSGCTQVSLFA